MLRGEGIPRHQLDDVPAFAGEQLNCRAVCRLAGEVGDVARSSFPGRYLVFHHEQSLLLCQGIVLYNKIFAAVDIDVRSHGTCIKLKGCLEQERDVVEAGVCLFKQVVVFEAIPGII